MATGDNRIAPLYAEGADITAAITAAVSSGTFVRPSGNFQAGPLLDVSTPTAPLSGGNLAQVATCGAGQRAWGVAETDGAVAGDVIPVYTGPGQVVPMIAGATITAGQEVESDAVGKPIPWAGTVATAKNGLAIAGAANGATVYVRLY